MWCMDMKELDEDLYLSSDFKMNMVMLNKRPISSQTNRKTNNIFDVYCAYNMGEQVNSIIKCN